MLIRRLSIIRSRIWLLVVLLSLLATGTGFAVSEYQPPVKRPIPNAVNGVLDLSEWDKYRTPIFTVQGEWRYFESELLEPYQLREALQRPDPQYREVPDLWNDDGDYYKLISQGYGTYILNITGFNEDRSDLAFLFNQICTSANVYISDIETEQVNSLQSLGSPGETQEETVPHVQSMIVPLLSTGNTSYQLVVQVANFHYRSGGICSDVQFGQLTNIQSLQNRHFTSVVLVVGLLLGIAIYNLGFSLQNSSERSSWWLFVNCLAGAVYIATAGALLEIFRPTPSEWLFDLHFKVQYASLLVLGPSAYMFLIATFKRRPDQRTVNVQRIIIGAFGAFILFFSPSDFTFFAPFIIAFFITNVIAALQITWQAYRYREPGALWLIVGISLIVAAVLFNIIFTPYLEESSFALQFSIIFFIFLQSQFIGLRFASALGDARYLSEKLQHEVERKTIDLQAQHRELLHMKDTLEQKNQLLEEMSVTDSLTKLYNGMYFDLQLEREWARNWREQLPLSFVLFDIDGFKVLNKEHGHIGGDMCLQEMARVLEAHCRRASDCVSRYEGVKFAVLLSNTDTDGAMYVAEQIRKQTESLRIQFGKAEMKFTVSGGIHTIVPTGENKCGVLFKSAEIALFQSKKTGKNKITIYDPEFNDGKDVCDSSESP